MWEFINMYSGEIISTIIVLLPLIYAVKGRIINDTNMLNTFKIAKTSIEESNNIKFDVNKVISKVSNQVHAVEILVQEQLSDFQKTILEFQKDELYQKMLVGLSELDELHKTLQNKDSTIEMLGTELKETKLALLEIKNMLKG